MQTPGEKLREFLKGYNLTVAELSRHLKVPRTRLERLLSGKSAMSVDTALRLEAAFGWDAYYWMELQMHIDLAKARAKIAAELDAIEEISIGV